MIQIVRRLALKGKEIETLARLFWLSPSGTKVDTRSDSLPIVHDRKILETEFLRRKVVGLTHFDTYYKPCPVAARPPALRRPGKQLGRQVTRGRP